MIPTDPINSTPFSPSVATQTHRGIGEALDLPAQLRPFDLNPINFGSIADSQSSASVDGPPDGNVHRRPENIPITIGSS